MRFPLISLLESVFEDRVLKNAPKQQSFAYSFEYPD